MGGLAPFDACAASVIPPAPPLLEIGVFAVAPWDWLFVCFVPQYNRDYRRIVRRNFLGSYVSYSGPPKSLTGQVQRMRPDIIQVHRLGKEPHSRSDSPCFQVDYDTNVTHLVNKDTNFFSITNSITTNDDPVINAVIR